MTLIQWYEANRRDLPWRDTKDAYRIWLSEIILQQTRVAQGYDYYLRFVERWPTVAQLAAAEQDDVLKLWQGLGYYSRARNLHKAAQQVMTEFGGKFPTRYKDLIYLKGIGSYTAAAIASFAADEAVAVVDGNVYRVLSRLYDVAEPIDTSSGQKLFKALAEEMLDQRQPGLHNQAMMELGALVCTPASPACSECPFHDKCLALANQTIAARPVKHGKVKIRERWLNYILFKYKDTIWVHQRGEGDIWQGLWEYLCVETPAELAEEQQAVPLAHTLLPPEEWEYVKTVTPVVRDLRHQLTHQLLHIDFFLIEVSQKIHPFGKNVQIFWENWAKKAVPKAIFDLNLKISDFFAS